MDNEQADAGRGSRTRRKAKLSVASWERAKNRFSVQLDRRSHEGVVAMLWVELFRKQELEMISYQRWRVEPMYYFIINLSTFSTHIVPYQIHTLYSHT